MNHSVSLDRCRDRGIACPVWRGDAKVAGVLSGCANERDGSVGDVLSGSPTSGPLIADQSMPGMPGDRLIQRCHRIRPDLPVILCTGSEQQSSEEEARSLGITEFILKPLMLNDPAPSAMVPLDSPQPAAMADVSSEELDAVSPRG